MTIDPENIETMLSIKFNGLFDQSTPMKSENIC